MGIYFFMEQNEIPVEEKALAKKGDTDRIGC
ncbi:MAG: hypothetical protein ACD_61C00151G0002 [uncultured bacterium]|nr:MAG: hypothetical protein ACD_61C00151G0002 [uncultured bacterium]